VTLPEQREEHVPSRSAIDLNDRAIKLLHEDKEQALSLLDKAIHEDPKYHLAYSNKGSLLLQLGRYAGAAEAFEEATKLRPHAAEYYMGHAFALARRGRHSLALDRCRYAIAAYNLRLKKDPENPYTLMNRALVAFILGQKHLALGELDNMLKAHSGQGLAKIVAHLRKQMVSADEADRWKIMGLD